MTSQDRAFVYLGKDSKITKDYEEFGPKIDDNYKKILGEERYDSLIKTNSTILSGESYFENVEQLQRIGLKLKSDECSKFLLLASDNFSLPINGNPQNEVLAAPAFYASEESFRHSGSSQVTDKPIGTYIHEFNHYLAFAFQKVPVYMLNMALSQRTGGQLRTPSQLESFLGGVFLDDSPIPEKQKRISFALAQVMFDQGYEQMNGILDRQIFKAIDVNLPKSNWRGKKKEYFMGKIPKLGTFAFPISGDFFHNLNDKEAFESFMQWERFMDVRGLAAGLGSDELLTQFANVIEKSKELKVRKISLAEMEKIEKESNDHSK